MYEMNPYRSPETKPLGENGETVPMPNPTKPLLYLIGGLSAILSPFAFLIGLFVGPQLLVAAIAMLTFGIVTIWLGQRTFDSVSRMLTVVWGITTTSFFVFLSGSTDNDICGMIFLLITLLVVVPIPMIALRQQPVIIDDAIAADG